MGLKGFALGAVAGIAVGWVVGAATSAPGMMATSDSQRAAVAKRMATSMGIVSDGDIEAIARVTPPDSSLTGVAAVNARTGEAFVAWALDSGGAFALGPVMDASGSNLTQKYEADAFNGLATIGGYRSSDGVIGSHPFVSQNHFRALSESFYTEVGTGEPVVHVFFDPTCAHCADLIEKSKRYRDHFRMRLIPVVSVGTVEETRRVFFPDTPEGEAVAAIERNTELMEQIAGRRVTPVAVYRDRDGLVRFRVGSIEGDDRWARFLAGLPATRSRQGTSSWSGRPPRESLGAQEPAADAATGSDEVSGQE